MGLRSWWTAKVERDRAIRTSVALNEDQALIAQQVPELAGLNTVDGMAYVLDQIDAWNKTATPEMAAELAGRLIGSQESFEQEGLTMPYWGTLWVLRTLQAELGIEAPKVASKAEGRGG